MKELLNLGEMYISDFIKDDTYYETAKKYPLTLKVCETTGAAKLTQMAPKDKMWGKYWYRSGTNASMTAQLENIAKEVSSRVKYQRGDLWLDIACNDGTMFKFIPDDFIKLGIDPAEDSYYKESSQQANVQQDFFSKATFDKFGYGDKKCKVITTIAMFYDIDEPYDFVEDIKSILADDGVWVVQMSYTPLMLDQLAFDNICHEHVYYYSLYSFNYLLEASGMKIVDCDLNDTNGGSFRVYIQKEGAPEESYGTMPIRTVASFKMDALLQYEMQNYNLADRNVWRFFYQRMNALKEQTVNFIKEAKAAGKSVYGYGASTKGNTLLQWFGLDHTLIDAIAERSPYKFGLKTVGTNIPIISEGEMRRRKPDYLLVLPWHFINEFVKREQDLRNEGTKFIVPCPKFEII